MSSDKWSIHKWKCRNNYRDGCRPVWMVSAPDGHELWFSLEFDTFEEARRFLSRRLAGNQP